MVCDASSKPASHPAVIGFELGTRAVRIAHARANREFGDPGPFGELGELGLDELHEGGEEPAGRRCSANPNSGLKIPPIPRPRLACHP